MPEVSAVQKKPYVAPQITKTPVFIEFTPQYIKENGLSNEVDRFPQGNLERIPEEDGFESNEANLLGAPNMKALKAPNGQEVIKTINLVTEIFGVLTAAVTAGRNLWETLADWVGQNDKLSDKEKVKAMQLGNVLAKQMSAKEAA